MPRKTKKVEVKEEEIKEEKPKGKKFQQYIKEYAKEVHTKIKRKFPRRKVITYGKDDVWVADLVDMTPWAKENIVPKPTLSKANKGEKKKPPISYKYMLNVIDAFTRYAWSVPLEDKTSASILGAFMKIVNESGRKPARLWTDAGAEFYNKYFKEYLEKQKISLYSTYSENKGAPVERFNRTLKTNMWKKFTENENHRWIDILPQLMKSYNHRKHSALGMSPMTASKLEGEDLEDLLMKLNRNDYYEEGKTKQPKFKVGDWVRLSKLKKAFEKGYTTNWTSEVYQIYRVSDEFPFVYFVKEKDGDPVIGSFYEEELLKTKLQNPPAENE